MCILTILCCPSPKDLLLTPPPPAVAPTVVIVSGSRVTGVAPSPCSTCGPPVIGTWHWEQTTELRVFHSRFRSWFSSFFFSSICRSIRDKDSSWALRSLRTCFLSLVKCWEVLRWERQSWRIRLQVCMIRNTVKVYFKKSNN